MPGTIRARLQEISQRKGEILATPSCLQQPGEACPEQHRQHAAQYIQEKINACDEMTSFYIIGGTTRATECFMGDHGGDYSADCVLDNRRFTAPQGVHVRFFRPAGDAFGCSKPDLRLGPPAAAWRDQRPGPWRGRGMPQRHPHQVPGAPFGPGRAGGARPRDRRRGLPGDRGGCGGPARDRAQPPVPCRRHAEEGHPRHPQGGARDRDLRLHVRPRGRHHGEPRAGELERLSCHGRRLVRNRAARRGFPRRAGWAMDSVATAREEDAPWQATDPARSPPMC